MRELLLTAQCISGERSVDVTRKDLVEWRELSDDASLHKVLYKVIRNDCRGFNNLSYTVHLRQEYVVALMDLEVYVLPLLSSIPEVKVRIRTAIETNTADMLQRIWDELDYRVDVCRITNGAHIEHL